MGVNDRFTDSFAYTLSSSGSFLFRAQEKTTNQAYRLSLMILCSLFQNLKGVVPERIDFRNPKAFEHDDQHQNSSCPCGHWQPVASVTHNPGPILRPWRLVHSVKLI